MDNRSINIWDRLELELAWSKKCSSYFENNFPIFLLSGTSNTWTFKERDVLYWVNFLVMKTFSSIFRSTLTVGTGNIWIYFMSHLLFIISNKSYLHQELFYYYHYKMMSLLILLMMRILFSFHLKLNSHQTHTFMSPLQQTLERKPWTTATALILFQNYLF